MFCPNCGKPLEEGQLCDCAAVNTDSTRQDSETGNDTITSAPPNPQTEAANGDHSPQSDMNQKFREAADNVSASAKGLWRFALAFFRAPGDELSKAAGSVKTVLGIEMMALKAVVLALISMVALLYLNNQMTFYDIPVAKPVITILLLSFVLDCAFSWILYLFSSVVFKGQTTSGKLIWVTGVSTLAETIGVLAGSILSLLFTNLGLIVIIACLIFGFVVKVEGFYYAVEMNKNRRIYALILSYIAFIIVFYLLFLLVGGSITDYLTNALYGLF